MIGKIIDSLSAEQAEPVLLIEDLSQCPASLAAEMRLAKLRSALVCSIPIRQTALG